jgi:AcrR family transcriptional regulator
LVHEKGFDHIAVKELLHRADVARGTFYSHFADTSSLLDAELNALLHRSANGAPPHDAWAIMVWIGGNVLRELLTHAAQRDSNDHRHDSVHARLRAALVREFEARVANATTAATTRHDVPAALVVTHGASAVLGVLEYFGSQPSMPDRAARAQIALSQLLLRRAQSVREDVAIPHLNRPRRGSGS